MAPSRRKGANKATAAVARQKWKVGDLVLAKVKGFPAWPATVSEPRKWGYPSDFKKVLVYFFGTQQIAFCNPVDVEEFTEEKKESLLGKHHGKGSDFVRALNEIVDCFEKLKQQNEKANDIITEEANLTYENNSDESLTKSVNDEALGVTVKWSCTGAKNDLNSLTEAAAAAAAEDALHEEEMQLEEANSNSIHTETHAYSTRSKTDAVLSRKVGVRRRKTTQKLRRSSRIDACRPQNLMLPSGTNIRSSRHFGGNELTDKTLRRSKRIVKSPDDSDDHPTTSPAFVCNDSYEDNGSEIVTLGSETLSFNDGSTADSGCKSVGMEPSNDINEGETELSDRLDFQTIAAILKRKRRPNRKRQKSSVDILDEVVSEVEVRKSESISSDYNGKVAERYSKEGGDEHLPLNKRARVRLSRLSPAIHEEDTSAHEENKTVELPERVSSGQLYCKLDSPGGDTTSVKANPENAPLLHASPERKPQNSEIRKNYVHSEAALPPSKRIHRALEAMSANVAEDNQIVCDSPTNKCSSMMGCSDLSLGKKPMIELLLKQADDHGNDNQSNASEIGDESKMELMGTDGKSCAVISDCSKSSCGINSSNSEHSRDSFEHVQRTECKELISTHLNVHHAVNDGELQDTYQDSADVDEKSSQFNCNTSSLISFSDGGKIEQSGVEVADKIADSQSTQLCSGSTLLEKIVGSSFDSEKCVSEDSADAGGVETDKETCEEGTETVKCDDGKAAGCSIEIERGTVEYIAGGSVETAGRKFDETDKTNHMSASVINQDSQRSRVAEEAVPTSTYANAAPLTTPVIKDFSEGHFEQQFNSNLFSSEHVEVRTVPSSRSSYATDEPVSVGRATPPVSSGCKTYASDNSSYVEKNSSSSPQVQLCAEETKLISKSCSKLESLSSFEATIRSLTRTKESIGRATRIAIDCAKYGFATKVVETLAHNLESEPSPPKKVDLFFLVDSITQCSGAMKGDAGIYPSAVQSVLPRLLLAAAPTGTCFYENHRQCLKVLRVWLDRKILPESTIRHHIRELESRYGAHLVGSSSRSLRFERSFDDPIREMEGMLVDEYGSNSSIQLPGFCMPPMLRDDDAGTDSDGESFEAVTPEHGVQYHDGDKTRISVAEKRSHILQDVDGELEMEDVAPCFEVETASTSNTGGADSERNSLHQSDSYRYVAPFVSQRPKDALLLSAPLPRSPSPAPPPPPEPLPHSLPRSVCPAVHTSVSNASGSKNYSRSQESRPKKSPLQRVKLRPFDAAHHRSHEHKDSESQFHRQMRDCSNACSFSDPPSSRIFSRASTGEDGAFGKGFHLEPPHPAPSNQFSYVHEQRIQSRRNIPPSSHPRRFHSRNSENGNFYRDQDRHKFTQRDNIGDYWRPPFPSISGPGYHNGSRMGHGPISYDGPPCDPAFPNDRCNYPPRSMNHRQYNHYRQPGGPIPVANRGPSFWKTR